jgi:hypothetical protein
LPPIYEEFYHTINNADHEKDLRLWSNTHGVNMAMNWPQFEVRKRYPRPDFRNFLTKLLATILMIRVGGFSLQLELSILPR